MNTQVLRRTEAGGGGRRHDRSPNSTADKASAAEIITVRPETEVMTHQHLPTLGAQCRAVTPGALLFIPQGEWVELENTGRETIRVVFIFSERGFDTYLRATSVPEGQQATPFSPSELAEIRQRFQPYITFKEK